jgi:CHAT domain-containing protein
LRKSLASALTRGLNIQLPGNELASGSLFAVFGDERGVDAGLLSSLALTGANSAGMGDNALRSGDGLLTAAEVSELQLSDPDLVVLSACDTGLGSIAAGEGVMGLQRAFQTAGAKCVVGSLWQVSDEETRALMLNFYDSLWIQKLSKIEALRQAQVKMLNRDKDGGRPSGKRTSPYYWAAFVLSGDWR